MARNDNKKFLVTVILLCIFVILPSRSRDAENGKPKDSKLIPPKCVSEEPAFMKISTNTNKPTTSLTSKVRYSTCYAAPKESHTFTTYTNLGRVRNVCSEEIYNDSNNKLLAIRNNKIDCIDGFNEVQASYNLELSPSRISKYGTYKCSIQRLCCK